MGEFRWKTWCFGYFGTPISGTVYLILHTVSEARQLSATGSLSGAIIGGVLFGTGMILARGCSSRILVLSATGNLRALVTGLVLAVVAQASLRGILSQQTFDPTPVKGISFVGSSADTLISLINTPALPLGFDLGLIPGVFVGSFIACVITGEFILIGFKGGRNMIRYLSGGALMGFGGMLAGGCTVGAALTGSSVFSLTAWVAMLSMWASGAMVHRFLEWRGRSHEPAPNRLSEPAGVLIDRSGAQ